MPLDAVCLTALTLELSQRLTGAKIDKVQMPERDTLLLAVRSAGENLRLLLSAGTGARVQFTTSDFENPAAPPMFCMLLRKHLVGARIARVEQPFMERMLTLELTVPDEMGDIVSKRLIIELIGRAGNIILVGTDGRIVDCLRHVDAERNELRQLLPGLLYRMPPTQDKTCFFSLSSHERRSLWEQAPPDIYADKWLLLHFSGLSPLVCRELAFRAFGDLDTRRSELSSESLSDFCREMDGLCSLVGNASFQPVMLLQNGQPRDFCFMPVTQYGKAMVSETYPDFSSMLDAFYSRRDKEEGMRRRSRDLSKTVKNTLERLIRKINAQENELLVTRNKEELRWKGDMITANLYRLEKGMASFTAQDYYHETCPEVTISIDPLKTPQQNAAAFYKAYTKAKNAESFLTRLLETERGELAYIESVMDELSRAESERELGEIRRELTESGILRKRNERNRRKAPPSKPLRFISDAGFPILVGRNNLQNDELTMKTARRSDIWLHTQKVHGSHVILVCQDQEPDRLSLSQAASLAAYYSQARAAGRVAVDYTQVRYVKKPTNARPGMVIYTDYKTIPAVPDETLVSRLSD